MANYTIIYKNIDPILRPDYTETEVFSDSTGVTLRQTTTKTKYFQITAEFDISEAPAGTTVGQFDQPSPATQTWGLYDWDVYYERSGRSDYWIPGYHISPSDFPFGVCENIEATANWQMGPVYWEAAYFTLPDCTVPSGYRFDGWRRYINDQPEEVYPAGYEVIATGDEQGLNYESVYTYKPVITLLNNKIYFNMGDQAAGSDPGPDPVLYDPSTPYVLNINSTGKTWNSTQVFSLTLQDSVFNWRDHDGWENGQIYYGTSVSTSYNGQWYYIEGNTTIYVNEGDSITFRTGGEKTLYACYATDQTVTYSLPVLSLPPNTQGNLVNYKWVITPGGDNRVPSYNSNLFESRNVKIFPLPNVTIPSKKAGKGTKFSLSLIKPDNSIKIISTDFDNTSEFSKVAILVDEIYNSNTNTYRYVPIESNGLIQAIYPYTTAAAAEQAVDGVIKSDTLGIYEVSIQDLDRESFLIQNISAEDLSTYEFKYIDPFIEIIDPPKDITLTSNDPELLATARWSYNLYYYDRYETLLQAEAHDYEDGFTIYYANVDDLTKQEDAIIIRSSWHTSLKDAEGGPYVMPQISYVFNNWVDTRTAIEYYNNQSYFKNYTYFDVNLVAQHKHSPITITLPYAITFGATFKNWVTLTSDPLSLKAGATVVVTSPKGLRAVWKEVVYRIYDSDYIGFTIWDNDNTLLFDSMAEGIYRVSDSSRYNENLLPNFTDKTQVAPGGDGTYYFTSQYTNRQISFPIAYDNLTEEKKKKLVTILARKKPYWLVFDEYPYKKYLVKAQSIPTFKWVPFNRKDNDRVYKGEGTLNFICYSPYALSRFKYKIDFEKDYLNRNIVSVRSVIDKSESHLEELAQNGYLLIKGYLSTEYLDQMNYGYYLVDIHELNTMSESEKANTVFYYWQYGNIDEWLPDAVHLNNTPVLSKQSSYDVFRPYKFKAGYSIYTYLYNPGDVEADFVLKMISDGSSYPCKIDLFPKDDAWRTKMEINLQGIVGEVILDTKQHCLYQIQNGEIVYLNDRITKGDFFKIPLYDDIGGSQLLLRIRGNSNGKVVNEATIEYNYLYY